MLNLELDELIDLVGGEGYVCRALNIHRTTLMRWRTGKVVPHRSSIDLLRALAGKRIAWAAKDWDGWRFSRDKLLGPEGEAFSAGELKAWWIERQLIPVLQKEVYRLRDMVKKLAADAKALDPAANDLAAWEGDPRAHLHAPPPPAIAPRQGAMPPALEPAQPKSRTKRARPRAA